MMDLETLQFHLDDIEATRNIVDPLKEYLFKKQKYLTESLYGRVIKYKGKKFAIFFVCCFDDDPYNIRGVSLKKYKIREGEKPSSLYIYVGKYCENKKRYDIITANYDSIEFTDLVYEGLDK